MNAGIALQDERPRQLAARKATPEEAPSTETILSQREIETLREAALGKTNKEIAGALFISIDTVKHHLKNIQLKLRTTNRLSAVLKAIQDKIIEMPGDGPV